MVLILFSAAENSFSNPASAIIKELENQIELLEAKNKLFEQRLELMEGRIKNMENAVDAL